MTFYNIIVYIFVYIRKVNVILVYKVLIFPCFERRVLEDKHPFPQVGGSYKNMQNFLFFMAFFLNTK